MFDDEDTCEPKDGVWKEGHEECERCHPAAKRLCKYFAFKSGFADETEVRRRRKLDVAKDFDEKEDEE